MDTNISDHLFVLTLPYVSTQMKTNSVKAEWSYVARADACHHLGDKHLTPGSPSSVFIAVSQSHQILLSLS